MKTNERNRNVETWNKWQGKESMPYHRWCDALHNISMFLVFRNSEPTAKYQIEVTKEKHGDKLIKTGKIFDKNLHLKWGEEDYSREWSSIN